MGQPFLAVIMPISGLDQLPGQPPGIWGPGSPMPTPPIHIPGGGGQQPPGIWGPGSPMPNPPIVIPPDSIADGVPEHPIYIPPEISGPPGPWPTPPIHIPPDAIAPGVPSHPIVIPPEIWGPTDPRPSHPIAGVPGGGGQQPPGYWGGGGVPMPTPPIHLPEVPDEVPPDTVALVMVKVPGQPAQYVVINTNNEVKPLPPVTAPKGGQQQQQPRAKK